MKGPIKKLDNVYTLAQHPRLRYHLPSTKWLTQSNLNHMLQQFSSIYIKPNNSSQGKGIMRVVQNNDHSYLLKTRDSQKSFRLTKQAHLWKKIQHEKRNRPYIIQQGIESRTTTGRLFDIRVHLTRINGEWIIAGIVGRIAPKNGIATNAYSGGIPTNIHTLLSKHMNYSSLQKAHTLQDLSRISMIATQLISLHYPEWSEYGLDIGIDANGRLWIYEINIKPGLYVFRFNKTLQKKLLHMRHLAH